MNKHISFSIKKGKEEREKKIVSQPPKPSSTYFHIRTMKKEKIIGNPSCYKNQRKNENAKIINQISNAIKKGFIFLKKREKKIYTWTVWYYYDDLSHESSEKKNSF